MRKRILGILAIALMAVGLTVIAPVAPASASFASCPSGHACMFDGANFTGAMLDLPFSTNYPGCHNVPGSWNDRASSLIVGYGSGAYMRFWLDANCTQSQLIGAKMLGPNQSVADLTQETYNQGTKNWSNVISSYAVYLP